MDAIKIQPETPVEEKSPLVRFQDLVPGEKLAGLSVTIVGAGGIGAPAALALAKMGVSRLVLYDFDKVDVPNLGTQLYSHKQLGQDKVTALKRLLRLQADWCEVEARNDIFEHQEVDTPVLIAAVDSLTVRRKIWEHVHKNTDVSLLIDPRMGAQVLNVISVMPKIDAKPYEETLKGEAIQAPCTAKATFYTGMVAGAMCAQAVLAWLLDERKDQFVDYNLDLRFMNLLGRTIEDFHAEDSA